jgi:parallel beta-helix repeat protein
MKRNAWIIAISLAMLPSIPLLSGAADKEKEAAPSAALATGVTIDAAPYVNRTLADCGLQKAIDEAAQQGGGTVTIPAGTFELRRGLVMKSNVHLQGAGMDKTVLTPRRHTQRLDVAADAQDNKVTLKELPDSLQVGSAVMMASKYPPAWYGASKPAVVTAVDRAAKTVTLEAPYGMVALKAGSGLLTFADAAALEKDVHKGDTEIHLKNADLFQPGDELAIGEPDNESMLAQAFVKEVRGNTLLLEAPAQRDFTVFPEKKKVGNNTAATLIWALFPMVHGANFNDASVRDLTVQGHGFETIRPLETRYTLSGIHFFNTTNVHLQRVAVRDWPSDGISLQTGTACSIRDSEATGCLQNGLHPGTGLTKSLIENNLAARNGDGLYFCWHNDGHILRNNKFVDNRGGGITGLGNPGDRHNLIENNLIARNGGPGIEINGGLESGNIIKGNTIENNSQSTPGKFPGIALYATAEDARDFTIEGNTIRDTQEKPTQFVGIEEKNGEYGKKPTHADENIIKANIFSGQKTADIILAGEKTEVEANGAAKIVHGPQQKTAEG